MNYCIDISKLNFIAPYHINGRKRASLPYSLHRAAGVYFIKENGELIYIGKSESRLYDTLYRHFQRWNDGRGYERCTYQSLLNHKNYEVAFIEILPEHADDIESVFITKYKPRDNKLKLNKAEFKKFYEDNRRKNIELEKGRVYVF